MRKTTLSLLTMVAMSSIGFAGGDFKSAVEPVVVIPVVEETVDHSGIYAGLGISAVIAYEGDGSFFESKDGQERTGDITFIAGYDFNQYIAVEGRYMTSFTHEDILERSLWGVYVKPQYPIMEELKVYALLGYGAFQLEGINGSGIDIDEDGFQWGVGTSYEVTENISIFVDYLNIAKDMEVGAFINPSVEIDSDAITVGAIYKF